MSNYKKIEVERSELLVNSIYSSTYQREGTLTAELSQKVKITKYYAGKLKGMKGKDNIFDLEEFDLPDKVYLKEKTRICQIIIPDNSTIDSIILKLQKYPKAVLYRILANAPILTEYEKTKGGLMNLEFFANNQIIRSEEDNSIILDGNGNIQYSKIELGLNNEEDIDRRLKYKAKGDEECDKVWVSKLFQEEIKDTEKFKL